METGGADETLDVVRIRRHDPVVVRRQGDHRRIDAVIGSSPSEERAGKAPETFVEAADVDTPQSSS